MESYNIKHMGKTNVSLNKNTSQKYFVNTCKYRVSEAEPNTKGWIDILKKLKMETDTDKSRVLLALLDKHEKITVKIGESDRLEHEYKVSAALADLENFIKFYCFFTCEDDYLSVTNTLCNGPGLRMKIKTMPYFEMGSVAGYKWSDLRAFQSILKQTVLTVLNANKHIGFIHGDLHAGNVLLELASAETAMYFLGDLGNYFIDTHGYSVILMDFEKSKFEEKGGSYGDALNIEAMYLDFKKFFDFITYDMMYINPKTVAPISVYLGGLMIKGVRLNRANIEHILHMIDVVEFR